MERTDRPTLTRAAVALAPWPDDVNAIKTLLDRGVEANARDPKGNTLLMLAASSDALPIATVKSLLDHGAALDAKNVEGQTALDLAKLKGATAIVDLLIKAGAKASAAPVGNPLPQPKPAASIRGALERSLPLLQKADVIFMQKSGCVSCHNNSLTAMTVATARRSGLAVDDRIAHNQMEKIAAYIETWRERALQDIGIPGASDTVSYILLGLAAESYPPTAATDALARYLKMQQYPDGEWRVVSHRPPLESSDIQVTAASLRALQVYAPQAQRAPYAMAVKRATNWLMKAQPQTTEERTFQLLGLAWAGVKTDHEVIKRAAGELLREQRADGGWGGLPTLASDAYATGQVLVALQQAGAISSTAPSFKKGIAFLLKTQLEDGSWYVKSRAIPLQPFFESGFPQGRDQFISAAGSNWAAMALALSVVPSKVNLPALSGPPTVHDAKTKIGRKT
ncbi:MAG: ankyrin repeat domain-containing protein [Acidobacteria bacterium]|nr:ankyrin repeat domain-containing protein [Acidobacteriota bacterium]